MERYTAVEIKHGRVAMIACVGYFLPEAFKFPGCENIENGLGAFNTIPLEGWLQLLFFVGAHEVFVKPREGGMGAYDLGLGTELLNGVDDQEIMRRQTTERNNGRLAMMGIWGMFVQDYMFGNPIAYVKNEGFWGVPVDFLVKDIPMCSTGCALPPRSRGPGLTARNVITYDRTEKTWYKQPGEPEPQMSTACPYLKYPEQLDGWVGGEKGFDPLNVTMALPVYLVREAELKHGRVAMLATLGWIATDLGARFPAPMFQGISTIQAHDALINDAAMTGPMSAMLGIVGTIEVYAGWLFFQGQSGQIDRDAGDFFLGKNFLPKDKGKANEMKLKELENGRLAMLAFSGICTQAVVGNLTKQFPETWPFM